jgi:class 3 adenylate cyclase/tetratricopeptide (TPR) repeat protein
MLICPGCGEENPPKFRLCGYCGAALAGAAPAPEALPVREMRKTVTIVFSDLKDSTALGERIDTEALHEVKDRYFSAMAAEIVRHGGKVEKYIGDAIMAVFGLPKAHEDDALRAVRAADGMRVALEKLNEGLRQRYGVALANRTGVNTGEVVANDDPTADQKLATGDAVNVAARLEQAAPVNQIYLGAITWHLVRDAVEVEAVEPLTLKGKAERVAAYRLVSAAGLDGNVRRVDTPLTGRDAELAALSQAWGEVTGSRAVRLVTVIGDAGMGKSRLIHEVIQRHGADATVLRGRCLPYGDGITFWPLVEMASAHIRADDSADEAQARLLELTGDADVAARLASAIGLSTVPYPLHELNWAARRFLQSLAAQRPLDQATDSPILLLASARHELVEERPTWPDRPNATRLVLRPLSASAAEAVVTNLLGSASLPASVIKRIVTAAEGNPLYVEQMLAMLIDSRAVQHDDEASGLAGMAGLSDESGDEIVVPPTIRALLEARLDRLGREERSVVPKHLTSLSQKRFIKPAESNEAEVNFRFHHQLVRDTVYNGLLKRARATLHIEFVRWQDRINAEHERGLEFEEILGYHLEQAHRYLSELGPLDEQGTAIGADAARRLSNAAKRAFARGDTHAAGNLYKRAIALLGENDPLRLVLLPEYGEVLIGLGDFTQARTVLAVAQAAAESVGHRRIAALARLLSMRVRQYVSEPGGWSDEMLRVANEVSPLFEAESAHPEMARAWRLIGVVHGTAARYQESTNAVSRAMAHARLAGDERFIARNAVGLASSALLGPTPVLDAIALCEQMIGDGLSDRQAESKILCTLAQLHAMNGDFDRARTLYRRGRSLLSELGQGLNAASTAIDILLVELLAGDLVAAEREALRDYEFLNQAGETYIMSTIAALLSRVVRDQGRDDEALAFSRIAENATAEDDIESMALWRSIRAPIIARAGNLKEAESLASSAVEISRKSDAPQMQADTLTELAAVLKLAGRVDEARQAIDRAIEIYRSKGDIVSATRATTWAANLSQK